MKKNLIAANYGGISNRIKCLISLWRISEKYNIRFFLKWDKNDYCGASFNKLFENEFKMVINEDAQKMKNKLISQTDRFIPLPGEIPDNFAKEYPTKRGNNIEFEFDRIPLNVRENICIYLNRLKPIKVISSVVNNFVIKYHVQDLVGVHIRRGDFMYIKEGLGKVSSDYKFIEKMNELLKEDASTRFLLCTDCQITENKFKKLFEDKIIIYPKKNRGRISTLNIQQGLVDLLLLSKTKHIIGTYFSTFSEVAWWLGGCKAKVDIIIDEKFKKQYEIKKVKMRDSKYEKFKVLIYKIKKRMFRI